MDVLVYSALNEQAALKKEIAERQQCLFDLKANTAGGGGAAGDPVTMAKEWLTTGEKEHWACPEDTTKWKIYEGTGWTGGVKVCDTSGYYRCGKSCTWTVPSGVTQARFQLWGAGGGANKPPCCCGHTVFGSTGAYASVIVPVQAGWTYTLCAGCAYCCYGYTTDSGTRRWSGCHSFVQGCKLDNFCADGGQSEMGNWMAMYGAPCTCRFHYYTSGNGGQFCNCGTDWCWNGESMTGTVPFVPGSGYHGTIKDIDNPTAENVIYGIRGMWPKTCFNNDHYGFEQHPPIYGFLGQTGDCTMCCPCYTSGNCCGCQCNATNTQCLRTPGSGGWGSHAMGGGNGLYGDSGRLGMVCVSYK